MKKLSFILSLVLVAQVAQAFDQAKCQEFADGIRKNYDGHLVLKEVYCQDDTYNLGFKLNAPIKHKEIQSYRAAFIVAACDKQNPAWDYVTKVNGRIYSVKNKELLNMSVTRSDCGQ